MIWHRGSVVRGALSSKCRSTLALRLRSASSSADPPNKFELTKEQRKVFASMLRVNQAGELAANSIYEGQISVLGSNKNDYKLLNHMLEQEQRHLETFNSLISKNSVRPSLLRPLWYTAGYILGSSTALISREAAMACTEAVETTIGEHYNSQIRTLLNMPGPEAQQLLEVIRQFRDEELEHLDIAVGEDSQKAKGYTLIKNIVSQGCKVAIWVAERV